MKHLASRRYGTVIESGPESAAARVRWDGGKTSRVGWKGLRTRCCFPREPFGPPPEVAEASGEVAASAPPARNRGGAGELHVSFWTQFARHLETEGSPARLARATRTTIASVPRGPHAFRLAPWNVLGGTSGIWARWDGPDADAVVERLERQHRDLLTAKLSPLGEVVWLPRDSKGSLLSLRRPSALDFGDCLSNASWRTVRARSGGASGFGTRRPTAGQHPRALRPAAPCRTARRGRSSGWHPRC